MADVLMSATRPPDSAFPVQKHMVLIGALSILQERRITRLLESQPDVEVVAGIRDPLELLLVVRETCADVVILPVQEDGKEPGVCSHLLAEYPRLTIFGVSPGGERMFELVPTISPIERMTNEVEVILEAIRSKGC